MASEMNNKSISTSVNSETLYRLGIVAKNTGLTLPQILREIARGGSANFLRKIGGVHR